MSQSEFPGAVLAKGVSLAFSEGQGWLSVLTDLDFAVRPGEFVSIIGPSGCGKTSLLKLLTGLYSHRSDVRVSGEVFVNGASSTSARMSRQIGLMFQSPLLLPWRTVIQNLLLPNELIQDSPETPQDPTVILEQLGLLQFQDYFPANLSGGMQQRVALARLLMYRPRILTMDEPFGALDEQTREGLNQDLLELWRQESPTVLFVTHSLQEAVFLSDRILVLTDRPASIYAEVQVSVTRPRSLDQKFTVDFLNAQKELRALVKEAWDEQDAGREKGVDR